MKKYLVCIESYTKAVPAAKGYKFENYEADKVQAEGFAAAKAVAADLIMVHNRANRYAVVIIRDLSKATKKNGEWFDAPASRRWHRSGWRGFSPAGVLGMGTFVKPVDL